MASETHIHVAPEPETAPVRSRSVPKPGDHLGWIALYAVTLVLQLPAMIARYIAGMLVGAVLQLVFTQHVDLGFPSRVGQACAVGPVAWSLVGLVTTAGAGWWWKLAEGGRAPSTREAAAYTQALASLRAHQPDLRVPRHWFVLDEAQLNAAALGDTVMLTRQLLASDDISAVLAHELAHLAGPEARVSVAINRLAVLPNAYARLRKRPMSVWLAPVVFWAWLASGAAGFALANPIWHAWYRDREYVADRYAADLGFRHELADFLETNALFYDAPVPFAFLSKQSHPPTELRIDRLREQPHA
jgi:Zn-dependent protease with chaperone function